MIDPNGSDASTSRFEIQIIHYSIDIRCKLDPKKNMSDEDNLRKLPYLMLKVQRRRQLQTLIGAILGGISLFAVLTIILRLRMLHSP